MPVIGVSTYLDRASWGAWDQEAALLPATYLTAVRAAAGVPALLPPDGENPDAAKEVVQRLDGLLLTGGPDITPTAYAAEPHRATTGVQPARDRWELRLLDAALAAQLPVLAVCRGAQLLAVAMGGSLHQHLPDRLGHQEHLPQLGTFGRVPVRLDAGQLPGTVLGERVTVPCHHHQAVDHIGTGLVATGWAADGTIEAVAAPAAGFVVGVQWHPEEDTGDNRLFTAFVDAARRRTER